MSIFFSLALLAHIFRWLNQHFFITYRKRVSSFTGAKLQFLAQGQILFFCWPRSLKIPWPVSKMYWYVSLQRSHFLNSRRRDQTSEQASRQVKEHSWVQKKLGVKWGGVELEGEKVGRTGITYSQSQTIYQNPSRHNGNNCAFRLVSSLVIKK